jgi:hypothetical protein
MTGDGYGVEVSVWWNASWATIRCFVICQNNLRIDSSIRLEYDRSTESRDWKAKLTKQDAGFIV